MKETYLGGARRRRRITSTGSKLLVVVMVATLPDAAGGAPLALATNLAADLSGAVPDIGPLPGDTFSDVPPASAHGLVSASWQPETPAVAATELAALSSRKPAKSATAPFRIAAAVVLDAVQDALAARLLHAAPAATHGLAASPTAIKALSFAVAQIGKPYLWGATGPRAYDCSGLVMQSYRYAGIQLPRTSAEQATVGTPVRLADLLPGDLLFYANDVHNAATIHHVAMYAGDGLVVHAPQSGELVHLSPVWLDQYIGAVRLVPAVGRMADGGPGMLPAPTTGVPVSPGRPTTKPPASTPPSSTPPSSTPPSSTPPSSTPPTSSAPPTSQPPTSSEPPTSSAPPDTSAPPASTEPPTSSAPPDTAQPPASSEAPASSQPADPAPSGSQAPGQSTDSAAPSLTTTP